MANDDPTDQTVEGQPLAEEDVQHFDSSFLKIDRDGNQVLSNTLEPGEKLATEQDDYELVKNVVGEDHAADDQAVNSTEQNNPGAKPGPQEPGTKASQKEGERAQTGQPAGKGAEKDTGGAANK